MSSETSVRALERGLAILECFDSAHPALSLSAIAVSTGLSTSTVWRLLDTLVTRGFLQKGSHRQYMLGERIFRLTETGRSTGELRQLAFPFLQELQKAFNETASLYVARNDVRICLESVQSSHALRRQVDIGEVLPLTQGAAGLLLLAWQPQTRRQTLMAKHAISEAQLFAIRQQGYLVNDSEHETGVFAIAAPVFDQLRQCVATIALSGPGERLRHAAPEALTEALLSAAHGVSQMIGYRPSGTSGQVLHVE